MYRLALFTKGKTIISPIIAPNNPNHGYDSPRIKREIERTGRSMTKNLSHITGWSLIKEIFVEGH